MKYKSGDKVKVRSYESMVAEYGEHIVIGADDDCNCQRYIAHGVDFVFPCMSYFCGKEVTIDEVIDNGSPDYDGYTVEETFEFDEDPVWQDWMFEDGGSE